MADALVAGTVKELQRSDPDAREQWRLYCDALGQGIKDPAKHTVEFLQAFIDQFNSGQRLQPNDPVILQQQQLQQQQQQQQLGGANLGTLFKEGQRKSMHFRNSWSSYCQHYGAGRNDPEKHENTFLSGFLDFLGQRGNAVLALLPQQPAAPPLPALAGPPAKRPRTDPVGVPQGMPVALASPGAAVAAAGVPTVQSTGDPMRDALIARIKAYQRSSEDARVHWSNHCDQQLGGIRDPRRHDASTLQMFVSSYGVP